MIWIGGETEVPPDLTLTPLICSSGYIFQIDGFAQSCVPCASGTYEVDHTICRAAGSLFYVPLPAQNASGRIECPVNTEVAEIRTNRGAPKLVPLEGATSVAQCTCVQGFYLPFSTSPVDCLPCPNGADCAGATLPPVALEGFAVVRRHSTSTALSAHLPAGISE